VLDLGSIGSLPMGLPVIGLLAIVAITGSLATASAADSSDAAPELGRKSKPAASAYRKRSPAAFVQPNIIVVYTDDQRWDTLPVMPAVSRLAEEGVVFTNSFTTSPVCGPSRASLLTGRYARSQGIDLNEGASGQFDPSDTIAVRLQNQGYTTALFGKYLNGYRVQFPAVPPGWSEWRVMSDAISELFGPGC